MSLFVDPATWIVRSICADRPRRKHPHNHVQLSSHLNRSRVEKRKGRKRGSETIATNRIEPKLYAHDQNWPVQTPFEVAFHPQPQERRNRWWSCTENSSNVCRCRCIHEFMCQLPITGEIHGHPERRTWRSSNVFLRRDLFLLALKRNRSDFPNGRCRLFDCISSRNLDSSLQLSSEPAKSRYKNNPGLTF